MQHLHIKSHGGRRLCASYPPCVTSAAQHCEWNRISVLFVNGSVTSTVLLQERHWFTVHSSKFLQLVSGRYHVSVGLASRNRSSHVSCCVRSIFVGIFSLLVFRRKQYLYQWLGIGSCVVGLVLNGVASAHDAPSSSNASKAVIGCVLVVLGMLASAVRCPLSL